MSSFLNNTGLAYFWGKITSALGLKADASSVYTKAETDTMLEGMVICTDDDGSATTASFDAQADTVWNKAQTLGSAQQAQARNNIGAVGSVTVNGTTYTPTNGDVDLGTIGGGGGGGNVISTTVNTIVTLTEAQYTALATKDSSTLYIITA